jgi:DNA-binding Lrp family transcriptional regulator
LYLTTCYNPKHKEVFPKQKTIADRLGISERSVTRAIQELFKEGLVLIECKYTNRYKFTSKIVSEPSHLPPENLSDDKGQNDILKRDNLSHHVIEQTIEPYKEPHRVNDYKILKDYAEKHNAKNVSAYIAKLKESGSAAKIIKDYKAKERVKLNAMRNWEESQKLLEEYSKMSENTCTAASCGCSLKDIKKRLAEKSTSLGY